MHDSAGDKSPTCHALSAYRHSNDDNFAYIPVPSLIMYVWTCELVTTVLTVIVSSSEYPASVDHEWGLQSGSYASMVLLTTSTKFSLKISCGFYGGYHGKITPRNYRYEPKSGFYGGCDGSRLQLQGAYCGSFAK